MADAKGHTVALSPHSGRVTFGGAVAHHRRHHFSAPSPLHVPTSPSLPATAAAQDIPRRIYTPLSYNRDRCRTFDPDESSGSEDLSDALYLACHRQSAEEEQRRYDSYFGSHGATPLPTARPASAHKVTSGAARTPTPGQRTVRRTLYNSDEDLVSGWASGNLRVRLSNVVMDALLQMDADLTPPLASPSPPGQDPPIPCPAPPQPSFVLEVPTEGRVKANPLKVTLFKKRRVENGGNPVVSVASTES